MHVTFYAALQRTGFQWQLGKLATKDIKADSKGHDIIIIPVAEGNSGIIEYTVNDAQLRVL